MPQTIGKIVAGAALALGLAGQACAAPLVQTTSGPVRGVERGGADAFLGIPYAAPPTGGLRWRAPAPPQPWAGVRIADHFEPNCPQPKLPAPGAAVKPQSEDCLYLNVWAPRHAAGRKLPVMFWIHGGSYILGSGDLDDTSAFTRDGVVLVSLNYRLGRLGFFAHPALTAESPNGPLGDYGILDQIAALTWVRDNIARFGGDPARVTIFGVSAGATFTDLLMISPKAQGLFQRAIAESDPFLQPWPHMAALKHADETTAEDYGAQWAAAAGAPNATAAELRALDYEKTLAAPIQANAQGVKPIIDGRILPERGPEAYAAGLLAHVPYIIGGNSFEGSLAAIYQVDPAPLVASLGANREAVLALYGPQVANNPRLLAGMLNGDQSFLVPRRVAARLASSQGVPTWSYHFAYVPEAQRAQLPGAPHGSEVPFVFESFPSGPTAPYRATNADRAMAARVHAYWVNFARNGDPNGPGLPPWPRFEPGDTLQVFAADGVHTAPGFDRARYDLIEPSVLGDRLRPPVVAGVGPPR
ncbi:MAG: Carboxylic ester hydrolase [Phenylobacterium sp.]|nr:Carboxylic ester hydrolase [Phenylobacterium sp.]